MGYYVHNKYDKASVDGLSTTGSGQTLVDYYTEYEKYKNLDTSKGFGKVYDTLEYITPDTQTGTGTGTGTGSHFNFASSIIIKSIQRGFNTSIPTEIPLNTINADKSIVLLNPGATNAAVRLESLSSTALKVKGSGGFSWQVIEYK